MLAISAPLQHDESHTFFLSTVLSLDFPLAFVASLGFLVSSGFSWFLRWLSFGLLGFLAFVVPRFPLVCVGSFVVVGFRFPLVCFEFPRFLRYLIPCFGLNDCWRFHLN